MITRLINVFTIVCLLVFCGLKSFAAEEPYENFIKGAIKKNDSLFVKDEKFKNPNFLWSEITNISVNNTLSLSILPDQEIAKSFNLHVTLRVAYFSSPDQVQPTLIDSVKLHVNYDKEEGKVYKSMDDYRFTNGYYVKVYVVDVQSPEYGSDLPEIFQLTSTIVVDRKYKFMPQMPISVTGLLQNNTTEEGASQRLAGGTSTNAYLQLSLTPLNAGEEYDIEWVMLDKNPSNSTVLTHLVNGSFAAPPVIAAQFFKNNSTRVTTAVPLYDISLVTNADVILVRVRQVSYSTDGIRLEGLWSYQRDGANPYAAWDISTWHESKMNWQYAASYAEEGKKKEVVTYFDGTLRGRQTVTLNNADKVAIVQENIYDQYGRVAASILPAPAQESFPKTLHYFQNFNQNSIGKPYSFLNLNAAFCETLPDSLKSVSGSSLYYSSHNNNLFKDDSTRPFNKYIPNAAGFPLSVTQYTADNTGRIRLQGGVGPAFQPGVKDSRTTKYYYAKPEQWELDRIFGNDVGYASHYLKNVVVDPNKQVSISYLNASGKTIATALTGAKPVNLEALSSLPVVKLDTMPLITSGNFVFNSSALSLTANTTYTATAIGGGKLKYNVEQLISRYPGGAFQPCSNCYYELKITVKDDCQNTIKTKLDTIGSLLADPGKIALHEDSLEVDFDKIGEYYVSFEFQLSKDVIKHFTDEFVKEGQANGALKKESVFILNELEKANFEDCLADCKTAKEKLGTQITFTRMFNGKLNEMGLDSNAYSAFIGGLYLRLAAAAQTLEDGCPTVVNVCEQYRIPMLSDVSPGGQYALFDAAGNPLETDLNVLFNRFKKGVFNDLDENDATYKNNLITLENGDVTSPYSSSFKLVDLVKYWQPEWAELFLDKHPEYCKLLFCYANSLSGNWDEKVRETSSSAKIKDFTAAGVVYSDTNIDNWLLNHDPFFKTRADGELHKPAMLADLINYSNNVLKLNTKVPSASIKNLSQYVNYLLYCADSTATTNQFGTPSARWDNCAKVQDCEVIDREWQMYRDMYLELKQKYFELARSSSPGCATACPVGTPIPLPTGSGIVPNPCGNVITLQSTGIQVSENKFTRKEGNTKYTYTIVKGIPGNVPVAPDGNCSYGTPVFYPCLTISLPNNVKRNFYNVWVFICLQNIPAPCAVSGQANVHGYYTYNKWYTDNPANNTRIIHTIQTSSADPNFIRCSTLPVFYNCFTVYERSGGVHQYTNVYVETCVIPLSQRALNDNSQNLVLNQEPTTLSLPLNVDSSVYATKKVGEYIIDDIESGNTYSILEDDSTNLSLTDQSPVRKINYMPYVFKDYFNAEVAPGLIRKFENVWIAEYIKGDQPEIALKSNSTLRTTVQSSAPIPDCVNPDFIMKFSGDYWHTVGYTNLTACHIATGSLDLYRERFGVLYYLGRTTIPAGQVTITIDLNELIHHTLVDKYYVCGVNPCKPVTPEPSPCSSLLLAKKSQFGVANRVDVVNQDPFQSHNDLEEQLNDLTKSSCEGGAVAWMDRLKEGLDADNIPQTKRDLLKAKLIDLCTFAGDLKHPLGASSLPSGGYIVVEGVQCRTFAEVIKNALGLSKFKPLLNPWLIDSPYPYNSGHQPVERTISNTNQELCNKLTSLRPQGLPDPQFYTYLKTTFGSAMTLSYPDFQTLLKACTNCRFILKTDIVVPQFLETNSKTCIVKADYSAAMVDLSAEFGNALTADSVNYETIVSNYLNHKWGFSLTYDQYKAFADSTNNQLCNELPYTAVPMPVYDCERSLIETAVGNGKREYEAYILEERNKFTNAYISTCASTKTNVKMLMAQQIYHYTLYYYDQAGNLIRTVPPEGVNELNETETILVNNARRFNPDSCNYNGPAIAAEKPVALQSLSNSLAYNGNAAVEMWLYQNDNLFRQMIVTTSDKKYMFQSCINGDLLNIDIYSLQQADAGSISITLSNHITANIGRLQPLLPWTHIVVQGNKLASGALQLWVNGKLLPAVTTSPTVGCSWVMNSIPSLSLPENITSLKHLRLYNGRLMTPEEIKKNAESGCLSAFGVYTAWHRFAVPELGGPTSIGPNSNVETQFNPYYPAHALTTTYAYNSANQVIKQESPDAGVSRFWYDLQSRLVASQNAKQASTKHSYTKYDQLGRITEVGEKLNGNLAAQDLPDYLPQSSYLSFLSSGTNSQLTQTFYDAKPPVGNGIPNIPLQENLRKRVSASIYRENDSDTSINASYYDYDLSGNVKTLYQQVHGLGVKKINYEYDLASGKVNFVAYQPGAFDQFYYAYKYDQENRLTEAWSGVEANMVSYGIGSKLNLATQKQDASYRYYLHGPLARVDLGSLGGKVQGLDYAYTLQGWLKGVNGNTLLPANDQGGDGNNGIARDAMAYSLGYYPDDYKPIGTGAAYSMKWQPGGEAGDALFNGNISNSTVAIKGINSDNPTGYTYAYDQLNRLTKMRQHDLSNSITVWSGNGTEKYKENYTYDGNGNILTLQRNGSGGTLMDNLSYTYNKVNGKLQNNKLSQLKDDSNSSNQSGELLKGQRSYGYDAIGNLITDSYVDSTSVIEWNVYGKIKKVTLRNNSVLDYTYDAAGNRVSKKLGTLTTWYVRDAQGNSLGVYDNAGGVTNWKEQQLYGSSRLGMWKPNFNLAKDSARVKWNSTGLKFFELNNHLGNVLAVISDKAINSLPEVVSGQDYYPFGMIQPGRSFSSGKYRYGFNGKENDNEVKGDGNQQDYGMRIYDPRIGKFLSVDPIARAYPELTPYQFASNSPVKLIDVDGLEGGIPVSYGDPKFKESLIKIKDNIELLHERGKVFVELAESANATNGKKTGWMEKAGAYVIPYWFSLAPLSDANDGAVLLKGKNLDGKKASSGDYIAAGVGVLLPAVSGSTLKKALEGPLHHIFTNKNFIRGEKWSEKFVPLFEKAGYDLNDALNKVRVSGHYGPHPDAYHEAVYKRMIEATEGLSGKEYKETFDKTIKELGKEAQTKGSELNKLLTKPKKE